MGLLELFLFPLFLSWVTGDHTVRGGKLWRTPFYASLILLYVSPEIAGTWASAAYSTTWCAITLSHALYMQGSG